MPIDYHDVKDEDTEEEEEQDDEQDDEGDIEGNTSQTQRLEDSSNRRMSSDTFSSSTALNSFLDFISTVCPAIPHLTYPLLLVVISTIPSSLLPLEPEPSLTLKKLFSHLWSPVDARLLSTHALPGQPSAFQAFLRDAVDCTTFLIGKAWKAEFGMQTSLWLVVEQMGERIWAEGVFDMGGRAKTRGTRGSGLIEQEALVAGTALSRVAGISDQLATAIMPVIQRGMIGRCFPSAEEQSKKAVTLLPRCLDILSAIRNTNTNEIILHGVDDIIKQLASDSVVRLIESVSEQSATSPVFVEALVEILRSHVTLIEDSMMLVRQHP